MAKKNVQNAEVKVMTLEERFASIEKIVGIINQAYVDGDYQTTTVESDKLAAEVKQYNEQLRFSEYDKWLAEKNPVLTALKQKQISQVSIKRGTLTGTDIKELSLDSKNVLIDLIELQEYNKARAEQTQQLFVSGQWIGQCGQFAKLIAERMALEVGAPCKDTIHTNFALDQQALECEPIVGDEEPNKLSNRSLKKAMNLILNNIYKPKKKIEVRSYDLNYLMWTLGGRSSKKLHTLRAPNAKTIANVMTDIMVAIVNKDDYDIEFREAQKK